VAGHLIECGAQATGGLWINADDSTNLGHVGYPIAEMSEDGTFNHFKTRRHRGAANLETVSEQLLYEVADPARYFTHGCGGRFHTPCSCRNSVRMWWP